MKQSALSRLEYDYHVSAILIILVMAVTALTKTGSTVFATPDPNVFARQANVQETKQADFIELKPGATIEREVHSGNTHTYRIVLKAGQYINIVVEQLGINVEVDVSDPNAKQIASVDWWWREGTESLWVLAEVTGDFTWKVTAPTQPAETGRYRLKIARLANWQEAPAKDIDSVRAYKNFAEGETLRLQGTAESRREAITKYQAALKLWRTLKDVDAEGQTLNALGEIYYQLGDLKQALEYMNTAIPLFRASGNRRGEVGSLNTLSVVYFFSGQPEKALENYNQTLPLARAIKDHITEARILSGLGVVLPKLGEIPKALEALNELLSLSLKMGNKSGEAMAHNNIGLINVGQGRLRDAIEHYTQTLSVLQVTGDRFNQATILNNIGNAYARMGEFQKGLEFLHQGVSLSRSTGDKRGEATNLGGIGQIYMKLGDYSKALEYYNQSLVLSRGGGYRTVECAALSNMGAIYSVTDELQKSLEYLNQALAQLVELGDRNSEAYVLTTFGTTYSRLGDPRKALEYYEKALTIRRAVGDEYGESYTLSGLGAVNAQLGDHQKATEYSVQALALARVIGDRLGEVSILYQLARLERDRNNLNEARSQIETALAIVESTRTKVIFADARSIYFASRQELYAFYIDVLVQLYKTSKNETHLVDAFCANERRSARGLLDSLTEARSDIRVGIGSELLSLERRLQQDLNAKADQQVRLLSRKHTAEQATILAKKINDLINEYEQVLTQIRKASPRYAALTQPTPLDLKQIQAEVLDSDTLLLEYSLGEERSYLWAVTPSSIKGYELPRRAEIEASVQAFSKLVTGNDNRGVQTQVEGATALSQLLLAPVAGEIGRKRLIIVSDGGLQYVPFAALSIPVINRKYAAFGGRTRKDKQRLTEEYQPLVIQHEIVQLPSASVLAVLRQQTAGRTPAAKIVAVLADPVFQSADPRVKHDKALTGVNPGVATGLSGQARVDPDRKRSGPESLLQDLQRLPFSRREAEAIVALAPAGQSLKSLDFDASRSTAISGKVARYRIIHFATHALINNEHPELSGIVLSLVDEIGRPQDGFLRLHDIYNLNLPAELVVLSGCQTALGKQVKGEGLVGLTRGFMYAGAARIVVSLWDVSDEATAELMKRFYEGMLKKGMTPAAALRSAQLTMSKSKWWSAPYYWAGFVLQGEWR